MHKDMSDGEHVCTCGIAVGTGCLLGVIIMQLITWQLSWSLLSVPHCGGQACLRLEHHANDACCSTLELELNARAMELPTLISPTWCLKPANACVHAFTMLKTALSHAVRCMNRHRRLGCGKNVAVAMAALACPLHPLAW